MIKKLLDSYTLLFLLISALIGAYLYTEFLYNKKIYLDEKLNNLSTLYKTELIANKKVSEALFDDVLNNSEVLKLISEANKNINKDQNRQKLFELFQEKYKRMSKKGILQFHFHLANAESFLRFHKPNRYGDSLLFRESIKKVIDTKKEVYGFEVGKYFDGFRYMYPLFYKEKFIGSVESSMGARELLNQLQLSTKNTYSLILRKNIIDKFIDSNHIHTYYSEFCGDDDFYIHNELHKKFHRYTDVKECKLATFNFHDILETNKPFTREFTNEKNEHLLFSFLPINNFKSETVGYIFILENEMKIFRMFLAQGSKFLVAMILLALLIRYLKRVKKLEKDKENNIQFNTIGKLSAGLSHEINTPVTIMKGNLEMLKGDISSATALNNKEYMLEDIQSLENNLNRIENITESMREIADTTHVNIQEVNIYKSLIISLRILYYKTHNTTKIKLQDKFFDLDMDWDSEQYIIKADYKKLELVFMSIINNAIDQLEQHGDPTHNLIDIQITQTQKYIQITIHDNGGGIDKKLLPNIFRPFKSNKEHRGLGIGLSVVKQIIDKHNFSIFVKNENNGALFTIQCYT